MVSPGITRPGLTCFPACFPACCYAVRISISRLRTLNPDGFRDFPGAPLYACKMDTSVQTSCLRMTYSKMARRGESKMPPVPASRVQAVEASLTLVTQSAGGRSVHCAAVIPTPSVLRRTLKVVPKPDFWSLKTCPFSCMQ